MSRDARITNVMLYLYHHNGYCDKTCRAISGYVAGDLCSNCYVHQILCIPAQNYPEERLIIIQQYILEHAEDFFGGLL